MTKKNKDSLGTRMKTYEAVPKNFLTLGTPKIIRLDMRAGHTFCKKFKKPFDEVFSKSMEAAMITLCEEIPGVVMGYTQSDEISLVLNDTTRSEDFQCFFDGNVEKIVSISASICTLAFNKKYAEIVANEVTQEDMAIYEPNLWKGQFDSRVFALPNVMEVHNYILWREVDATRNSIQMVGHSVFTDKELHLKNSDEIQDMLFVQKNINWNDFPSRYKRGFVALKEQYTKDVELPNGEKVCGVKRKRWTAAEVPILTKDSEFIKKAYNRCLLVDGVLTEV